MTLYNVHLYREMRLMFDGIEAECPEAAAAIARARPTADASDIDDCEGEDIAALVDVAGDADYAQSVSVEFEGERQRRAAPTLLEALRRAAFLMRRVSQGDHRALENLPGAAKQAEDAIAEAGQAGFDRIPSGGLDIHTLLAGQRQIAEIWGVSDVKAVRPDLTADQAWQILQLASRRYDAAAGINWDVLSMQAEELFGGAPAADDAEA